jgi:hypothetical protein
MVVRSCVRQRFVAEIRSRSGVGRPSGRNRGRAHCPTVQPQRAPAGRLVRRERRIRQPVGAHAGGAARVPAFPCDVDRANAPRGCRGLHRSPRAPSTRRVRRLRDLRPTHREWPTGEGPPCRDRPTWRSRAEGPRARGTSPRNGARSGRKPGPSGSTPGERQRPGAKGGRRAVVIGRTKQDAVQRGGCGNLRGRANDE